MKALTFEFQRRRRKSQIVIHKLSISSNFLQIKETTSRIHTKPSLPIQQRRKSQQTDIIKKKKKKLSRSHTIIIFLSQQSCLEPSAVGGIVENRRKPSKTAINHARSRKERFSTRREKPHWPIMEKESGQDPKRPFKGNTRRKKTAGKFECFFEGKARKRREEDF